QLVTAAEALDDPSSVDPDDKILCHLVDGTDEERAERRALVPGALAGRGAAIGSPAPTRSGPSGGSGCATRWPASTPRRSPPPTSSASSSCGPSGWPETQTPGSPWSRNSSSWRARSAPNSPSRL